MKLHFQFILTVLFFSSIFSCGDVAPTVTPEDLSKTNPVTSPGSTYPQVQAVYPDASSTPSPNDGTNDIYIVFSRTMENDAGEMGNSIEIREGGTLLVSPGAYSINEIVDSKVFTIDITTGFGLQASTTYDIRILSTAKSAAEDTDTAIDFSNLALPVIVTAGYAQYQFTTSATPAATDGTAPTLTGITPTTPVPIDLNTTNGRFTITFDEAVNPSTVDNTSITLEDSLTANIPGTLEVADSTLTTYYFYPGQELEYNEAYTFDVSVGNVIEDLSGNAMVLDSTTSFTTANFTASTLSSFNIIYDQANPTQVTVTWYTGTNSVKHIELDDANPFAAALVTEHRNQPTDGYYQNYHSHTFTTLTPGQEYSFRIMVDSDETTLSGGTFDATYTLDSTYGTPVSFRTIPDTSVNSQLSVAATAKSALRKIQGSSDYVYIFWKDSGAIRAQYMDTSAAPSISWGANGSQVFSVQNDYDVVFDDRDGVIVSRIDNARYIYASSIRDSAGITYNWGNATGITVYDDSGVGTNPSNARIARVYDNAVQTVASGTSDLEFVYDTGMFASVSTNDIVMNSGTYAQSTVSSVVDNNLLTLAGAVISSGNLNFRIADNAASTPNNILTGSTYDDSACTTYTAGTFDVNAIQITVPGTAGANALASAIQTTTGASITASAVNNCAANAYIQITESGGANLVVDNPISAVLTEFGLNFASVPALTMKVIGAGTFESSSEFNVDDFINNSGYSYVSARAAATTAPWTYEYTVLGNASVLLNGTFTVHSNIVNNGVAETNFLYDQGVNFSAAGVAVNDIVINKSNGVYETVSDISYAANGLVRITTANSAFLFDTDNTAYHILRLQDGNDFITSGIDDDSYTATQMTQTGVNFATDGVNIGDIIYNMDTDIYAVITNIDNNGGTNNRITMSANNVFTNTNQAFIIYRKKVIFVWQEGDGSTDNIYGKTIADNANSTLIYPDATTTNKFNITTTAGMSRNPYIIGDSRGDAIVIYELENGGNWDIRTKKISADGTFQWGGPDTGSGTLVVSNQPVAGTEYLIQEVVEDGYDGAWVAYGTSADNVGIVHIRGNDGNVTTFPVIANSYKPDIEKITTNQVIMAFETLNGSYQRAYVRRYSYNGTTASVVDSWFLSAVAENYNQINVRVASDNNGGFIASWLETKYYPSVYYAIFAQHYDNSGVNVGLYSSDRYVAIPVKDDQYEDPYNIEHFVLSWVNGGLPDDGFFIWLDERSATVGAVDIYYQNLSD